MPLQLPDVDCAFCAYLRGDVPYTILERGPVVSVLVTFEQRGLGHVLVVPTEHRPTIFDLTGDEAGAERPPPPHRSVKVDPSPTRVDLHRTT